REGSNGRGDLCAGDDGELGGSPARCCAKPVIHLAPIGDARQPDRGRQRRGGGAGVGLSGVAEPGSRASSVARQEDPGGRDSQGGSGTRRGLKKTAAAAAVAAEGRYAMKTVAEVIGVSRSNLVERLQQRPPRRIGRPPLPDQELVAQIKATIAELPTYGYRRVHAILKRQALAAGLKPPNHKRVYRVMKIHSFLLDRHAGFGRGPVASAAVLDHTLQRGSPAQGSRMSFTP